MQKMLIVKWVLKEAEVSRIQKLLPELTERSRNENGNVFFTVYQSEAEANVFVLHECYADAEAAEAHRGSEHYQRIVVNEIIPHLAGREVIAVRHFL